MRNIKPQNHYDAGGISCIDYLRAKLTTEELEGFYKGNILKYLSRANYKEQKTEDYKKALEYMKWLYKLMVNLEDKEQ